MNKIMTFGIDQAFGKTAIVTSIEGKVIDHQIITTEPSKDLFAIFLRGKEIVREIMNYILGYCNEYPLCEVRVILEGLSFGSAGAAAAANRDLAGLQFLIMSELLEEFDIHEIAIIPPTTLKKFATTKGNAKKEEMVDAVKEKNPEFFEVLMRLPKTKGRYDVADAFWLSQYK